MTVVYSQLVLYQLSSSLLVFEIVVLTFKAYSERYMNWIIYMYISFCFSLYSTYIIYYTILYSTRENIIINFIQLHLNFLPIKLLYTYWNNNYKETICKANLSVYIFYMKHENGFNVYPFRMVWKKNRTIHLVSYILAAVVISQSLWKVEK